MSESEPYFTPHPLVTMADMTITQLFVASRAVHQQPPEELGRQLNSRHALASLQHPNAQVQAALVFVIATLGIKMEAPQ